MSTEKRGSGRTLQALSEADEMRQFVAEAHARTQARSRRSFPEPRRVTAVDLPEGRAEDLIAERLAAIRSARSLSRIFSG